MKNTGVVSRRDFTAWLGGAAIGTAFWGGNVFAVGRDDYSVSVLGDMHYDASPAEKFHSIAMAKWRKSGSHKVRFQEFERNARMWQDICKRILAASAKTVRSDAAFMLQLGDLVQGDCESDSLHRQMLSEATGLLTNAYKNLPVLSLCGNHDIREGDDDYGSAKAYAEYMLPFLSKQLGVFGCGRIVSTTFGFRRGPDLWIILDFNYGKRDAEIVKRLLAENENVRYTFIATHGPVLPMQQWQCRWFYLGSRQEDALRRQMRALFAKRNVIVLAGHAHSLELKDWHGDGGRITEMILNTCAGKGDVTYHPAEPDVTSEEPASYGDWAKDDKYLFDEYRAGFSRYFLSRAVGHHVLRVADSSVALDYYGHDSLVPTRQFVLR